ncbi:MAG TPA: BadF/BadG/BcrA/BcrD ATPase family protein [Candidatus Acidoferrum sp.]|nr:BadF/BadG/BcrA/BcrD ATPase family protein [Candidatus Acidoferrum sp.]
MGLDGGGTKTDCVVMEEGGRILGRGRGAASNPSRIGLEAAARGVRQAAEAALNHAGLKMEQVTDICAGLAGVAAPERAAPMREMLSGFFAGRKFELCTDLDLALAAAGASSAIVLVAGTGSAAIGRNGVGRVARSGGHGPNNSDEGSAFSVGKRAVEAVKSGAGGSASALRARILEQLGVESAESISGLEGDAADAVYPRVFPIVANAAEEGDELARGLLHDAAKSLASLVKAVHAELGIAGMDFLLGKTGGMVGRSNYFDDMLDAELRRIAPQAKLEILRTPLAEVAARLAVER